MQFLITQVANDILQLTEDEVMEQIVSQRQEILDQLQNARNEKLLQF